MIDFPSNPHSGQSYTAPAPSNQIYVFDGVKWIGTTISGSGTPIPSQINNSGKLLTTNGSTLNWATELDGGDASTRF